MRVKIEVHMLFVGGQPRWQGQIVDMPPERVERILATDNRMSRPASVTVLPDEGLRINTATREQLIALSGVGADRADQIIAMRPFESLLDMSRRVQGIGPATIARWQGVKV